MTRAVIADDEPLMREQLRARLDELWPELEIVAEVKNGVEAVEHVVALRPEVVFLDIRMPAKTGIEAAREIRVVTVERLRKRLAAPSQSTDALQQALARLAEKLEPASRLRWIQASVGNQIQMIPVDDVLFFVADEKYTRVQTAQQEALIRKPIKELLAELDPAQFWQIHRSTLINTRAIAGIVRDERGRQLVAVKGRPEKLEVSRSYAHLFKGK